jgi:hypothetical protein
MENPEGEGGGELPLVGDSKHIPPSGSNSKRILRRLEKREELGGR